LSATHPEAGIVKFEIQQEDLQKALDVIANVVPSKTTLPILSCVLLEATKEGLTLSATNLDISITTTTTKANVKDPGRVAIPAVKFVPFVRSLRPGAVTVAQKGEQITLTSGKSRLAENTMNVEDYPVLKKPEEKSGLTMPADMLIAMINETAYAVSRDETRPALTGILWEVSPTALTMVATDAHRLARSVRKMDWKFTGEKKLIVDTNGLRQIPRIAAAARDEDAANSDITVFIGGSQLAFRAGSTVLQVRLLEGPFPDYQAVLPKDNDKFVTVDKADFAQSVRRVAITADRVTSQIRLGIEAGRMELTARGAEGSQSEDEISVSYQGDPLEIGFNYSYLQDILKNLQAESVVLSLKDSQSAALIKPVQDTGEEMGVLCLLMPLRLAGD
jgi:DNA polymerase-3 subunit beta